MPHSDPAINGEISNIGPSSDVGETLIFSPDLIKTDAFNPEDHVILVVPDSSDNLVTDGHETDGAHYITIPAADSVQDDNTTITVDPSQFGDSLKPNFLFITKLVPPSKLPSGLVPIASEPEPSAKAIVPPDDDKSSTTEQLTAHRNETSSVVKSQKHQKTPKNLGKCHTTKQEGPEIFGKRFPASFNEVLFKKIHEIVVSKNGPDTNDDTEVLDEIVCPHCRKQQSTLKYLKEHLYNCHTYVNKRKLLSSTDSPVRNRPKRPLHRCPDCKAVFISSDRMANHNCRRSNQVFGCLGDEIRHHGTPFSNSHCETAKISIRSSDDENLKPLEKSTVSRKSPTTNPTINPNPSTASRPDACSKSPPSTVKETPPPKCLGCRAVLTSNFQICDKCLANAEIKGDTIILECDFDANETEDGSIVRMAICAECKCSFNINSTSVPQTLCGKCSIDS